MLIAIVAVVVFLSALLFCLIRQNNKEQVEFFQQEEMKKELVETAEYLEQIDDIVLRNHDIIQGLYGSDGQMQTSMDTLDENFVQNMVKQIGPIMKKSEDITLSLKEMQSQITNNLDQYDGDSLSQTEYLEQMSEHIETIISNMESTQKNLQELLKKSDKEAVEHKNEIKAETAKIQKMLEESNEMLGQFYTNLEDLEKQHINLSKNNQTELLAGIKQLQESMTQNMDSVTMDFRNLTKQLQTEMEDMNLQIDVKSQEIQTKLQEIHVGIGQTESDIMNLLNRMEEDQSKRMEQIKTITIEEIKGAVTKTEQALEDAKRELTELVEELQVSQDERHLETMSVLTDMEDGIQSAMESHVSESLLSLQGSLDAGNSILKETMTNHFQGLNVDLSDASKQMTNQFGELTGTLSDIQIKTEQQITELRKVLLEGFDAGNNILQVNMLEKFGNLDTNAANNTALISENMKEQIGTLGDTVNQNGQDIKNSMDLWMNSLNEKLTEVFQSVSEGKQLIASALTDKGVSAGATESFANLANKIKLITSNSLSGNIKYTYHVHVPACTVACTGTMYMFGNQAVGNGKWRKDYACGSCHREWSTTESDQPQSRICVYGTPTIACGKTTNTIEKAEIVFNSAAMTYDEPIEDFGATVPAIEDGVLESEESNTEEEMIDENDAGNSTQQNIGEDLEEGTVVEAETEEMTDETVSGNNPDM